MNAAQTKEKYTTRLDRFFRFIAIPGSTIEERCKIFVEKGKNNNNWVLYDIRKFLQFQKERVEKKEISGATLRNYIKSIKLFCEMNDILIPWKKLTRGLPKGKKYADDRAPTIEEIHKIIEYPDRRIKAIVYTLVSSGIRLGAWDYLRWGNIKPIEIEKGRIVAAKILVYEGDEEEYFTFITPEAYNELEKWMLYRRESGETITNQSWLMRNIWDTKRGYMKGLVTAPKKLKSAGVKRLMEDALWTQGLRRKLEEGKRRHEFQADHGLRKWFKTRCEISGMKPINIEKLMNHSTGISDSYYRATESELLEDYLKAVDYLTINEENRLKKKVKELTRKQGEIETMKERHEQEIKDIRQQMNHIISMIQQNPMLAQIKPEALIEKSVD